MQDLEVSSFCCEPFEAAISRMGKAGFSIVLRQSVDASFFALQSRGCDERDVEELRTKAGKDLPPIRIVEQETVHFCPYCGTKLSTWLGSHQKMARELLVKSKPLLT